MAQARSRGARLGALLLTIALLGGCSEVLAPGEWGTLRYFGQLPGDTPMRFIPPVTDRNGNVYVLQGTQGWLGSTIYVGHRLGGWTGGCSVHKGEGQVLHGFVGTATDRAWWWSGDALARVSGETGQCQRLVAYDTTTGAEIDVVAAIPWINETPTETTMLAMIKATAERQLYHAVIDLDLEDYSNVEEFQPDGADDVMIIGTGASPVRREGYVVVSYVESGKQRMEGLFLDELGTIFERVPIDFDGEATEYMVQGFLQASDDGLVAGMLSDGRLLIFNDRSGGPKALDFDGVGVVAWEGQLYVSGFEGDTPVIAEVESSGSVRDAKVWRTAEQARSALNGRVEVLDERTDPSRTRTWDDARPAFGGYPFLSAHPHDNYTNRSTGWLVAGPGYSSNPEDQTAVAFGPVGMDIP